MKRIRIGTLVSMNDPDAGIRQMKTFLEHGFESFGITFWQSTGKVDLAAAARRTRELLDPRGIPVSCVSLYGNPLQPVGEHADSRASWERVIDAAPLFGASVVSGFTGRVIDRPIEESIPVFKEVFGALADRAAGKGLRIAFENCTMGGDWSRGDWNIAHNPDAWELMFASLPGAGLGLEWEPCHQMTQLIDPIPQLRKWAKRIYHVHGKDATIARDVIAESGVFGRREWVWHRTPGFGDTNWSDVVTVLMQAGYAGTIDIEGWHDPVFRDALELSGQVRGLAYLKDCRGGSVDGAV